MLKEGWLHSGDAGYFTADGQLIVIDRLKDVMHLTDGTRFSPQFIENKLKFSPYVKEAVVLGDKRERITALINIDMPIVGKWAEKQRLGYTTYTDLSSKPEVYGLIEGEVRRVNRDLAKINARAVISKFVLLYKELDADDDRLLDVGRELQLVLDELRREARAVEQMHHVLEPVDDDQLTVLGEVAGVPGVQPAVHEHAGGRLVVLVVAVEDAL